MAKDVLNKSKLSEDEERIMEKVVSGEYYRHKQPKICKTLDWLDSRCSYRLKVATIIATLLQGTACFLLPDVVQAVSTTTLLLIYVLLVGVVYIILSDAKVESMLK